MRDTITGTTRSASTGSGDRRAAEGIALELADQWALSLTVSQGSPEAPTFDDAADSWLSEQRSAHGTLEDYGHCLATIRRAFSCRVDEIDRDRCKAFDLALHDAGRAPATRRKYLFLLRSVLALCIERGQLERNPADSIRVRGGAKRVGVCLTDEEALALLRSSRGHVRLFCWIGLYGGMRKANILGLQWMQVDMKSRKILVPAAQSKTGAEIQVPIHRDLLVVLRSELVAGTSSRFVIGKRVGSIDGAFHRAVERAGIARHVTPHDLRHTLATRLLGSIPYLHAEKILGHVVRTEAWTYFHPGIEELVARIDQVPGYAPGRSLKEALDA